jgi:hypothetical protein
MNMQYLNALREAAKTGGLFFSLTVWMAWLVISRQKWLM